MGSLNLSEMEQISGGIVCDCFPPLSAKYVWLVGQSLEGEEHNTQDQIFYTLDSEVPHYRCRIPELLGKRIRGCFHGWLILSSHPNNNKWSLWNQVSSKIISLPTLILKDGEYESISECCLSAPPDDPSSILLLTRTNKPTFVFCRLDSKRKKFRWFEMSYAHQLKRLTSNGKFVYSLNYCNGKVYALNTDGSFAHFIIHVDIVVKDKEVVIKLMLFGLCPFQPSGYGGKDMIRYLKGSSEELIYIEIYFEEGTKKTNKPPTDVYLFKIDMTSINWEVMEGLEKWDMNDIRYGEVVDDLKDSDTSSEIWEEVDTFKGLDIRRELWNEMADLREANFFVDLSRDHTVSYSRVTGSDFGGFIHIRGEMGETIYSYNVKDNTISLSPIFSPILATSHISMWDCRLQDAHGEAKCIIDSKDEMEMGNDGLLRSGTDVGVEYTKSHLLNNIPFTFLETIMEYCAGIEYMNFRSTCKQCYLAAPSIKWSSGTLLKKLKTYSVISPWLMVVDKKRSIITFKDPMLGGIYFMKTPQISLVNDKILCSRFGWLLFESNDLDCLVFFNPFTNDIRKLLKFEYCLESLCFSAPPSSLDCVVVGFTARRAYIHFVNQEQKWRTLRLGTHPHNICFSTFHGQKAYALCKGGELIVINILGKGDFSWKLVEVEALKGRSRSATQYFLTNCDRHLLHVSVGEHGEVVEVLKGNDSKDEWAKVDSLGKHMIYLCDTVCLCIEAKSSKLENKIVFPRLHPKTNKVMFYSFDTGTYNTFDGENIHEHFGNIFGATYHLSPNVWIEPNWS